MQQEPNDRTRDHAYRLWEEDGRPEGRAEEYWHRAERELADGQAQPGDPETETAPPRAQDLPQAEEATPRKRAGKSKS